MFAPGDIRGLGPGTGGDEDVTGAMTRLADRDPGPERRGPIPLGC